MGLTTCHVHELVPSLLFFFSFSLPLPTATNVSGTIIVKLAPLSGSSLCMSLHGYQTLAPRPWQATLIHGLPLASVFQIQPPSHGGRVASRGFPIKEILICCVLPVASLAGKLT